MATGRRTTAPADTPTRTHGRTDTDTRTLQHMPLPGCREQLHTAVGKTAPKAKGKIPGPSESGWDHLPGTWTGRCVCSLSVTPPLEALWGVEPRTRQHLQLPSTSEALLPSQYPDSPDNYTSPFSTSSLSDPRLNNHSDQNENLFWKNSDVFILISDKTCGPGWVQSEDVNTVKSGLLSCLEHVPTHTHEYWGCIKDCHESVRSDCALGFPQILPF